MKHVPAATGVPPLFRKLTCITGTIIPMAFLWMLGLLMLTKPLVSDRVGKALMALLWMFVTLMLTFSYVSAKGAVICAVEGVVIRSNGIFTDPETEEIMLAFRYPGVGQVYVGALYETKAGVNNGIYNGNGTGDGVNGGRIYLPVGDLFSLLGIHYTINAADATIEGFYLEPENSYLIDFDRNVGRSGKEELRSLPAEQLVRGEMDYYLAPILFEELFGLEFTVNLNTLTLSLHTEAELPAETRGGRNLARNQRVQQPLVREDHPLLLDRNRSMLSGGFLDYSFSAMNSFMKDHSFYNYNFNGGAELLGGDLQGAHSGHYTPERGWLMQTRNLRWRYVVRESPYFSQLTAGQIRTSGLQSRNIRGVSVSNDPVERRRMQGSQIVEGVTVPGSDVELYMNNQLAGYATADALGSYRFEVPLQYGVSRLQTRIFTPSGETFLEDQRIRTPFYFLPAGVVTYQLEGGITESELFRYYPNAEMAHGKVSVGLTDRVTAGTGIEYIEGAGERPFLYGSLSGRVFDYYLMSADVAPDAFYRFQGSVVYPSTRSITAGYTYYTGASIYNTRYADQLIQANFYSPVRLGRVRAGVRLGGDHLIFPDRYQTRLTGDLYFRMRRANLRFSYRDEVYSVGDETWYGTGQIRGSATFSLSGFRFLPSVLNRTQLRISAMAERDARRFRYADIQLSRNFLNNGRFYLGAHRDFHTGHMRFQAGISIDLGNRVRSTTEYRNHPNDAALRQNLRGSAGFDENSGRVVLSPRVQTGRSAASVLLFIDHNSSGTFDEGDEILPYAAVRIDRTSLMKLGRDGVLRLSQLQSYYRYNMEVLRSAIPDPLLVPAVENFSFIADPNQYKRIEIPFYRTGVVEGSVTIVQNGEVRELGGLRIVIEGIDHEYSETVRTFHNGTFYAMDLLPGRYSVKVDPGQLELIGAEQEGGPAEFEIRPLSRGDVVEGVEIRLVGDGGDHHGTRY